MSEQSRPTNMLPPPPETVPDGSMSDARLEGAPPYVLVVLEDNALTRHEVREGYRASAEAMVEMTRVAETMSSQSRALQADLGSLKLCFEEFRDEQRAARVATEGELRELRKEQREMRDRLDRLEKRAEECERFRSEAGGK